MMPGAPRQACCGSAAYVGFAFALPAGTKASNGLAVVMAASDDTGTLLTVIGTGPEVGPHDAPKL